MAGMKTFGPTGRGSVPNGDPVPVGNLVSIFTPNSGNNEGFRVFGFQSTAFIPGADPSLSFMAVAAASMGVSVVDDELTSFLTVPNDDVGVDPVDDGAMLVYSCTALYDDVTLNQWVRQVDQQNNADEVVSRSTGLVGAVSYLYGFDGDAENWNRLRCSVAGLLITQSHMQGNDGANYRDLVALNESNLGGLSGTEALMVLPPGNFAVFDTPATATQASVSTGNDPARRFVCTSIVGTLIIPPAANQPLITLQLIDSSGPTVIWQDSFGVGAALAAGDTQKVALSDLNIAGSLGANLTLAFSAAGVAGTQQSVAMTGYSIGA